MHGYVDMHFYDKLAHTKNSVNQALIWIRPEYEAILVTCA